MTNLILTQISKDEFKCIIGEAVKSEFEKNNSFKQEPQPEYIDRKEAAKILGVSKPTMIKYQKEGVLPSYRIASRIRYKRVEVVAALKVVQSIKHKRA